MLLAVLTSFGINNQLLSQVCDFVRFRLRVTKAGKYISGNFGVTVISDSLCSLARILKEGIAGSYRSSHTFLLRLVQCLTDGLYLPFHCRTPCCHEIDRIQDKTIFRSEERRVGKE